MKSITFNNFSLNDSIDTLPRVCSYLVPDNRAPEASIQSENLATRHGAKFLNRYFQPKIFRIEGHIAAATKSDLQAKIDAFLQAMSETEANLDIEQLDGTTRRWVATASIINAPRDFGQAKYANFAVEFLCSFPFGKAMADTTITHNGIVASPSQFTDSFGGTAPLYPIFTITINSQTSMTQIELENTVTDHKIIISPASFNNGDVIIINCLTANVIQNGTEIEFTGFFPEYKGGTNNTTKITITDGGAFDVDLSIEYTPFYL